MKEIESTAHLFEHAKSGARLLYLRNSDDNKVFCITMRTPPVDDCGTPHIMEHSVLGGSERYPLKEPFVTLMKSSLNTFLNAMTYPDKTMYPVASKNDIDFANLMHVYCDGVFAPNITENKFTFYQEGWHYHIEEPSEELKINGIVYSEMKGAFGSPEDVLMRNVQASLYPDTPYAFESGGDPDEIPKLTYERFVELYKMYYHPSNSYIYLYGDMDIEEHLAFLDREYLSHYDRREIDSLPALQPPFSRAEHMELSYSYDGDDGDQKSYFARSYAIGETTDTLLSFSFSILEDILLDSDASPLKAALLDADIADEITSSYTTCVRQPYFSIVAKNAKADKFELFNETIDKTLLDIAETGISDELIKSALNGFEFDLREADSGSFPKGLIYLIDIMESWLYDERPGTHLCYEQYLSVLSEHETSEYYTDLIKKYLLNNPHQSTIQLSAKAGLNEAAESALREKLAEYKKSLSEAEINELIADTRKLLEIQNSTDSEEAKATIPVLEISEIDRVLPKPNFERLDYRDSRIFTHTDLSRGIAYLSIYFPFEAQSLTEVSEAELLTKLLCVYATNRHSELSLASAIGINLGGINAGLFSTRTQGGANGYESRFVLNSKVLCSNIEAFSELALEILTETKLDDPKRLYQTVCEEISKFELELYSSAHSFAASRISAFTSSAGALGDHAVGIGYYNYLKKLKVQLEANDSSELTALSKLLNAIVTSRGADVLLICDEDEKARLTERLKQFIDSLPDAAFVRSPLAILPLGRASEAVKIPSKVNYVALGTNYRTLGLSYQPQLPVFKKYLTSGYLWDQIRVLGGAYGAMFAVDRFGTFTFVSYRDPNLLKTLEVYRSTPEFIRTLDLSESDVKRLIISTISDIDTPQPVYTIGRRMLYNLYRRESWEEQSAAREAVLSTTAANLRELSDMLEAVVANASVCAVGNDELINAARDNFERIYSISEE